MDWLYDSSFCLINTSVPTQVAPSGVSSLIDLSLCSSDLFASSMFQVEDDTYDIDNFPIIIQVELWPPLLPGSTLYKWPFICWMVNDFLLHSLDLNNNSFLDLVRRAMNKHSLLSKHPAKGLLVWWSTNYSRFLQQKRYFLKKARELVSTEFWMTFKLASTGYM